MFNARGQLQSGSSQHNAGATEEVMRPHDDLPRSVSLEHLVELVGLKRLSGPDVL